MLTGYQASLALAIICMFVAIGALGFVIWRLDQIIEDLDLGGADRDRKGPRG